MLASLGHSERQTETASVNEEFRKRFPNYDIEKFLDFSRWTQSADGAAIFRDGLRKAGVSDV